MFCQKMRKKLTKHFWNIEVWAVQKHVNLVDLVKSFPTHIYLQNLASIQPRTSPLKFVQRLAGQLRTDDSLAGLALRAEERRPLRRAAAQPGSKPLWAAAESEFCSVPYESLGPPNFEGHCFPPFKQNEDVLRKLQNCEKLSNLVGHCVPRPCWYAEAGKWLVEIRIRNRQNKRIG